MSEENRDTKLGESPCSPNGFGLCQTHPTCEHVKHALKEAWSKHGELLLAIADQKRFHVGLIRKKAEFYFPGTQIRDALEAAAIAIEQ